MTNFVWNGMILSPTSADHSRSCERRKICLMFGYLVTMDRWSCLPTNWSCLPVALSSNICSGENLGLDLEDVPVMFSTSEGFKVRIWNISSALCTMERSVLPKINWTLSWQLLRTFKSKVLPKVHQRKVIQNLLGLT